MLDFEVGRLKEVGLVFAQPPLKDWFLRPNLPPNPQRFAKGLVEELRVLPGEQRTSFLSQYFGSDGLAIPSGNVVGDFIAHVYDFNWFQNDQRADSSSLNEELDTIYGEYGKKSPGVLVVPDPKIPMPDVPHPQWLMAFHLAKNAKRSGSDIVDQHFGNINLLMENFTLPMEMAKAIARKGAMDGLSKLTGIDQPDLTQMEASFDMIEDQSDQLMEGLSGKEFERQATGEMANMLLHMLSAVDAERARRERAGITPGPNYPFGLVTEFFGLPNVAAEDVALTVKDLYMQRKDPQHIAYSALWRAGYWPVGEITLGPFFRRRNALIVFDPARLPQTQNE